VGPNGTPGARNSRFTDAPIVIEEIPPRSASAAGLTRVSVTFSEEVAGVRASDMTLNGVPAFSVGGAGAGPYVFEVDPPNSARVRVSLAAGRIENREGRLFPGDTWEYATTQVTVLSLPDDAAGGPGATVQVPLSATPANGILGIDMTILVDPTVILTTNVTVSGIAASAGFALIKNLNTPGVIIISMYATQNPLSGSGEIARIQFSVVGTPGAASGMTFSYASINENAITAAPDNGLFSVNCAGAANGTPCNDGSGCTVNDQCLGGSCGGTPVPAPGETANARMESDGMTFSWDNDAGSETLYDVVRGDPRVLPVGPGGGDESCLGQQIAATSLVDATTPPLGEGFWYLVRGGNACGKGTYGYQAINGVPTVARVTASCP
jgi:hypothetical protein